MTGYEVCSDGFGAASHLSPFPKISVKGILYTVNSELRNMFSEDDGCWYLVRKNFCLFVFLVVSQEVYK